MSYGDAFDALAKGPPKPKTTDITITEGRTIARGQPAAAQDLAAGQLRRPPRGARRSSPRSSTARRKSVRTREGFLFPATYQVRVGAPVSDLVDQAARRRSASKFATVNLRLREVARSSRAYDVLIIASMIEREAAVAKDRAPDRLGDLQPAQPVHPARASTRRSATGSTTGRGRCASPSSRTTARTTRAAPGPAADADRQPGPGARSAPPRARRRPTSSTSSSSRAGTASTPSRRPTPSSSARPQRYERRAQAKGGSPVNC